MYCFACNIFKLDSSGRPKNYQKNLLFDIHFFKFYCDSDLGMYTLLKNIAVILS
jgi:hypothetical protein